MQEQLSDLLAQVVNEGVETNEIIPFKKITTIHFARFVILDECQDVQGNNIAPRLVFTTNYDMPLSNHFQQMITFAGKGLWQIFSLCKDFPYGEYQADVLETFLLTHSCKAATFYVGVGYRSVQQIHNEHTLRNAINDFSDRNSNAFKNQSAVFIRQQIIDFVRNTPELQWAQTMPPPASIRWQLNYYGKLIMALLLFLIFLPLIIPFVIIWMLIMLNHEIREINVPDPVTKDHIRELVNRETQMVQAQFSAMGNIKAGWFRLATVRFLLGLTNFLAPYLFTKGKLSGIPTVQFARWLLINEGKQMLFLSNYDGNSENYLRDFIHIAAKQLTLLFCHTEGYPKTRLMIFGGAKDAEGFMAWARCKQLITTVWYSANKEVSVRNIYNNAKIREGLQGDMKEAKAEKWLRMI